MIITCPSCETKYAVDEERLTSSQQKMRCSRCSSLFLYETPGENKGEGVPEHPTEGPSFAEVAAQAGIALEPAEAGEEKEAVRPARSRAKMGIISVFLLLLLCSGAYLYWINVTGAGDRWLRLGKLEGQEMVLPDGRVFVVTGAINNRSTKGRKSVVLRVRLFDREGKVFKEKDALAGMVLSGEQVRGMDRGEIERRVAAFKLSPGETFRVDAGKEIPFSVLFFDHDFSAAKEFTVEIVQSSFL